MSFLSDMKKRAIEIRRNSTDKVEPEMLPDEGTESIEQNDFVSQMYSRAKELTGKSAGSNASQPREISNSTETGSVENDFVAGMFQRAKQIRRADSGNIYTDLASWMRSYNALVDEYRDHFGGREGTYKDPFLGETERWTKDYNYRADKLLKDTDLLRSSLEQNKDILGDGYGDLVMMLDKSDENVQKMREGYSAYHSFYSQFKDDEESKAEDKYKQWQEHHWATSDETRGERQQWYEDSLELLDTMPDGKEKEELQAKVNRYERGTGEFSTSDRKDKYANGFVTPVQDEIAAQLLDPSFRIKANKAAAVTHIPDAEEAEYRMNLELAGYKTVWPTFGEPYYVSDYDGAVLVSDGKGGFIHPELKTGKYSNDDRLGIYLSLGEGDIKNSADKDIRSVTWNEGISKHWDYMTTDEIVYYYGLRADNPEKADQFLDDIQRDLNHRYQLLTNIETAEEYRKAPWYGKLWMNAKSVFANVGYAVPAMVSTMTATMDGETPDIYGAGFRGMHYADTVRGETASAIDAEFPDLEIFGMTGGEIYQAGMSGVDSMATRFIPGGRFVLAASAGAHDAMNKYEAGATSGQIGVGAATAFGSELLTESLQIEQMKLLKAKDVATWTDYLLNIVKSMGVEYGEESLSYLINGAVDVINRKSQSDWAALLEKNDGNYWSMALDILGEANKEGMSGAFSGSGSAALTTVSNAYGGSRATKAIGKNIKAKEGGVDSLKGVAENQSSLIDKGLAKYAARTAADSSDKRVGKLALRTGQATRTADIAVKLQALESQGYSAAEAADLLQSAEAYARGGQLSDPQKDALNKALENPNVADILVNRPLSFVSNTGKRITLEQDNAERIRRRYLDADVKDPAAEDPGPRSISDEIRDQLNARDIEDMTDEQYDEYFEALLEQEGLAGITEEQTMLQERNEVARRYENQNSQTIENQEGDLNGTGILHGSGQRYDSAGAGQPAGSLGSRAGQDPAGRVQRAERIREEARRRNIVSNLRTEPVSSRSQGIQTGTDNATMRIVPEESWTEGMTAKARQIYEETGKQMVYVAGPIEIVGRDGNVRKARGADTQEKIFVRIDHTVSADQIADHESFHGMLDAYGADIGRDTILEGILEKIRESFTQEQLQAVLDRYNDALCGLYDGNNEAADSRFVLEELLADAYAGINFRGLGATKFSEAVQTFMRENHMSRETVQENGTRQTNAPPAEGRTLQQEIEAQWSGEPAGQKENTAEIGGERYLIEILQDGRKYVRADRQVIFGNDPDSWSEQVEDYINGKIRRGQDVSLMAENGGVFTITSETAGKMADNHTSDGRTLDDEKFYVKANAAVHIDELVQISKPANNKVVPDRGGRHGDFAAGGWRYRVAYFHDFDGKHYRIQFSVADGNKGNVPYNIGDIEERSFPKITGPSANGDALNGETSSKHSIRNQLENVKQQIQAVLDKVSPNHAEQMRRYTELKDSNHDAAQRFYDGLMESQYSTEFEEYLKLTDELAELEAKDGTTENAAGDGSSGYTERASLDDDAEEQQGADRERAKAKLIEELRRLSPQDIMGDRVGQLIDQYTREQPVKPQEPKIKVDRGNLRRAISSTLGLTKELSAKLSQALDEYTDTVKPKRKQKEKADPLDVESKPVQAKKQLRKKLFDTFSIPAGQRGELGRYIDSFADRIVKNGKLTEADRKAFFTKMYESGAMTVPADEYSAQAREYLKGGRIYVSDSVVADLGDDWERIRRRAFAAGIYLTRQRVTEGHQNAGIDMWNQELAGQLPWLFDAEATDRRSMLEQIVKVAEDGRDEKVSLAEYISILAEDQRTSEDEILDDLERQMSWALQTFAETADIEIELKDRNMRRVLQERQQNKEAAERRKAQNELRGLQQRTLKTLQWLNRNRHRAPEELRAAWDEVLGDIDLYAVGAANEMNWSDKYGATWKDLAQMYKNAQEHDPNFLPSEELKRIVDRLDATKIGDMDLGALQDLYKAAIGLRTEFHNRNNVINDEMQRLFAEVYEDSKREIEAAPGGYKGGKVDKFFNLEQLTAMNVLQRMGGWDPDGAFYSMARQLEKGERDMRAYNVAANGMLEAFLRDNEAWVKRADGQGKDGIWYKVEIPELVALELGKKPEFGKTITVWMTPAQKVHMYLESKNQDNLRHMTGGRTFADKELYSRGKRQEALSQGRTVRLAPETVKAIVSDLTEEEMELAQLLEQYYNSFATGEINRVSNILYGYDKAMGSHYAPIYTNRNYTKTEFGVFDVTAEGVGNLKGRQYAVNPSYNISAFDAFERHVDQTARFVGMAIPARNWTTLMNWREKNNSTADVITHKWGEEGKKYITDLITTLQAGDDVKNDVVSSTINKLQSNYISAIFGANLSIVLKQLGSIPLAGAYLGMRNMPSPRRVVGIDRELIKKYTPDLAWRTMGYTSMETRMLKENPNWTETNKVTKFIFGGGAITAMDGWAASTLWPWAENKVRKEHPELEIGTQEQIDKGESPFYKKVAEEFENAVSRSQSVSDEIHQGRLRKSKNPITRAFTLFRSDSAQTYNAIRQKIGEMQYYARTGATEEVQKRAKSAVGAAVGALMINALWGETISFLMALWKNKGKKYWDDEDDEMTIGSVISEMGTNVLASLAGVIIGGEELFEIIGNVFAGEKWYGIDTPGMEQLTDMIEEITTAGGEMRNIIAGAVDVLKNGGDLGAYFAKHGNDLLGVVKNVAEAGGMYLAGVPVSNLEAYLMGALKWISPELGAAWDDLFANPGKSDLDGLEGDALAGRMMRILGDRQLECSDETGAALARLYQEGEKSAFPGDTPQSITIEEESRKLSKAQQQTYDRVWSDVVGSALDDLVASEAFQNADAETQAKMLSRLYSYAGGRAKSVLFDDYELSDTDAKTLRTVAAGISLADYVAWQTITSGMKNAEKMEQLLSWDLPEEAKIAIVGSILGTDMETESGKPTQYAKFLDALEDGLSVDDYLGVKQAAGDDDVSDAQIWRVTVDSQDSVEDQLAALSVVMSESQYRRVKVASSFSVNPDAYVKVQELLPNYDADGNGSYKQTEVKAAIDGISRSMTLTNTQKAALWQLVTGSTSAKNNPYNKDVGQKVIDAIDKLKQQEEEENAGGDSLSFSGEIMRQLMARA